MRAVLRGEWPCPPGEREDFLHSLRFCFQRGPGYRIHCAASFATAARQDALEDYCAVRGLVRNNECSCSQGGSNFDEKGGESWHVGLLTFLRDARRPIGDIARKIIPRNLVALPVHELFEARLAPRVGTLHGLIGAAHAVTILLGRDSLVFRLQEGKHGSALLTDQVLLDQ